MKPELYESWRASGALVLCTHEYKKTGLVASAVFSPGDAVEAARKMYEAGYFLEDLSVMQVREGFWATWHFDSVTEPGRVAFRALSQSGDFWSLCSVYQGAEWHEREASDFFGVTFVANTNPVPLLLADDFAGKPPLLKAEKDLAAMCDLSLFGEAEVLDEAWAEFVKPAKEEEGAA